MTQEIMKSFKEILSETNWIDKETKNLAAEKVDAMSIKIGYPDFILVPEMLNDKYKNVSIANKLKQMTWLSAQEKLYSFLLIL